MSARRTIEACSKSAPGKAKLATAALLISISAVAIVGLATPAAVAIASKPRMHRHTARSLRHPARPARHRRPSGGRRRNVRPAPIRLVRASSSGPLSAAASIRATLPPSELPGWRRLVGDDFNYSVPLGRFPGATSGSWWAYPEGWRDTTKKGMYSPSQTISVHNGMMDLYLHSQNGTPLSAAPVPFLPGSSSWGRVYGLYAVRFRADPVPGYKTAWLLWPDSERWPQDGEIDFPEGDLNGKVCAHMHYLGGTSGADQTSSCSAAGYTGWHTAVIVWTKSVVGFVLDGRVLETVTQRIPNTPMHYVLQTETATDGAAPPPSAAGHVYIDWVAIYAPA